MYVIVYIYSIFESVYTHTSVNIYMHECIAIAIHVVVYAPGPKDFAKELW